MVVRRSSIFPDCLSGFPIARCNEAGLGDPLVAGGSP
jgi:hypothetical protein